MAAPAAGGQLRVRLNGAVLGTVNIPNTGGWQTWQTVTLPTVSLAGGIGSQALRLEVITNGFSINWIGLNATQHGTNIALYKVATASSLENAGYPATNAFDGNLNTRWSSAFSDPQWIYVDLGATYNISEVTLYWEAAYGKSYQIQVSSDATNWTTIYSTTTGLGGTEDLAGLSGTGRYVRMYGTARGTVYGYSLWEFQVYGTPVVPALYGASLTNGQFGFWINGNTGTNYTIMASTNLTSWNPIFTTNPPSLPYFWIDTNSSAYPVRFYRTVLGP